MIHGTYSQMIQKKIKYICLHTYPAIHIYIRMETIEGASSTYSLVIKTTKTVVVTATLTVQPASIGGH